MALTWSRMQSVLARFDGWSGQSAVLLIQVNHGVHVYSFVKEHNVRNLFGSNNAIHDLQRNHSFLVSSVCHCYLKPKE